MTVKIVAENLGFSFPVLGDGQDGQDNTAEALRGFSLTVQEGEFLSILGPSGCGKSTFLNILAGLLGKSRGDLRIDGQTLVGINPNQGVVFQGYALFPWRSVIDNIAVGLEIRGIGRAQRRRQAQDFLELVGLSDFGHRYPHELSGGMKQRVAIARSLAYDPDVLLMDEPFAALDAQTRETLQDELLCIWERTKKTIVFITHSLDEAIFLSDRIAVMTHRPGRVKEILTVDLPRPRAADVRNTKAFVHLRQRAWEVLKDEVLRANALARPSAVKSPAGTRALPAEVRP